MFKAELLTKLDAIPENEPLFLLRGRDVLAAAVVDNWSDDAESSDVDPGKVAHARALATLMADYQPQRLPD